MAPWDPQYKIVMLGLIVKFWRAGPPPFFSRMTPLQTYIMSSSNKIDSAINNRSFLSLLLNAVIRRFWGFIIDAPERSFIIKFLAGLLFGFWSPDFSLCVAYVKSEQFGHKSGPERGGYFRGQLEASEGLPGTRTTKSLCWG